jgi:hypothetical protein
VYWGIRNTIHEINRKRIGNENFVGGAVEAEKRGGGEKGGHKGDEGGGRS